MISRLGLWKDILNLLLGLYLAITICTGMLGKANIILGWEHHYMYVFKAIGFIKWVLNDFLLSWDILINSVHHCEWILCSLGILLSLISKSEAFWGWGILNIHFLMINFICQIYPRFDTFTVPRSQLADTSM